MSNADFTNIYDDRARAKAYAALEYPATYYLAYRDLGSLIAAHVQGGAALDFGCGAGRSTRVLRGLGFDVVGLDISEAMLARARARDPQGDYRLVPDGDVGVLPPGSCDLVLSAFTFDNIPTAEKKIDIFRGLRRLLRADGRIVSVVSSPDIYVNEWASFSTRDFPENRNARCGDTVRIVMLDVEDRRPVEDVLWTDDGYREVYDRAALRVLEVHKPLGSETDGRAWVSETRITPWVLYVLAAG
jgi:SAM-dependent methyltransferase